MVNWLAKPFGGNRQISQIVLVRICTNPNYTRYGSPEREWSLGDSFSKITPLLLKQTVPVFSVHSKQNRKFVILMALKWGSCRHESIWFSWIKTKPWTLSWKVNLGKFVYKDISCTKVQYKNSYVFQLLSSRIFSNKNISTYPFLRKEI